MHPISSGWEAHAAFFAAQSWVWCNLVAASWVLPSFSVAAFFSSVLYSLFLGFGNFFGVINSSHVELLSLCCCRDSPALRAAP